MTQPPTDRLALVDRLLADPPIVHPMDRSAEPVLGVWSTDVDCYRFLAERCLPGQHTLETGTGLSTVLFAGLGTHHICVTPGDDESDRVRAYCERNDIATDHLRFVVESSHAALPRLQDEIDHLDVVFIDGGHGFPLPIVDWFYAAPLLRVGGLLVVDDIGLPAPRLLVSFLDSDPRWKPERRSEKWAAFTRLDDGNLVEDWFEQPFFRPLEPGIVPAARRIVGSVLRKLGLRR